MKVEIISMQRVYNQGSFLQAYGLKQMVRKYTDDVRFGDIIEGISNMDSKEHFEESVDVPMFAQYKIRLLEKLQKRVLKKAQEKILEVSKGFSDGEQKDIAFIGSDEMFNCLAQSPWGITSHLFGDVPNCKKIFTYAVSCGHTTYNKVPECFHDYIRNALSKVTKISVRDENTGAFVQKLTGKSPQYNIDPVFVFDFANEIVERKLKKRYILIYAYSNRICDTNEINVIKNYAKKRGLITVGAGVFQYWCDKNIIVEPFELLGYFKNAEHVITDTFHGAVLSIKYNRNFAVFVRNSNEKKLYDLLLRFKLESRRIVCLDEFDDVMNTSVDFTQANNIISKETCLSMKYIQQCIEEW